MCDDVNVCQLSRDTWSRES